MKVNVLGTDYDILVKTGGEDECLRHGNWGYCDSTVHSIVIAPFDHYPANMYEAADHQSERRATLRHEIIHAFLAESGLTYGSSWAQNENCVEWIAQMFPKLLKAFVSVGALNDEERGMKITLEASEIACSVLTADMVNANAATVKG